MLHAASLAPIAPPPMTAISAPFKEVDFTGLPELRRYIARDGASLAFSAHDDYEADLRAVAQPLSVIVGERDELSDANAYRELLARVRPGTVVETVPNLGHITLTTSDAGISAAVAALTR